MPFSRRFYPKRLTVMCAYILRMGGPGNRTHYPGVTSAMLYQLSYRRTTFSCANSVSSAVWVSGLRRSRRWRSRMWRSWAGVVTRGLRLWGRLDVLPNDLKWHWRRLMVEKLTFNSLATALVDIPAVSMPIARSLKTWDICGIVLCDKTAHFRVAFYCPQHKVHLCNDHAV